MRGLSEILSGSLEATGAGGVLCAISRKGGITTHSSGNITVAEHGRPFYIYSISKSLAATAVMMLSEQRGGLLDERLLDLMPELLDKSYGEMIPSEVTVRQVLNHSSGLSDYFSQKEYQEAVHTHPEKPWTYEKLMEVGLKNTPLFPPGEGWMYSNPGYALIKELIAHLGGMTDEEWMAKHILEPLGLADTRYFKQLDTSGCLLPGNDPEMDGDFRARYHPGWIATGCFISTVSDVVRFYDGLFSNKLVNADSLAEMTSVVDLSYPLKPPSTAAYGLGLMHAKNHPLGKSYGHGGGGPGYTTYAQHYPEKNLSLAMVWNRSIPQTPFDWADEVVCSLKYSV